MCQSTVGEGLELMTEDVGSVMMCTCGAEKTWLQKLQAQTKRLIG